MHAPALFPWLIKRWHLLRAPLQMVQLPRSPRSPVDKAKTDSDSALSPAWSVVSGIDSDGTNSCLQSSVQALQYQRGLRQRCTVDSDGSAGSDEDLYRLAQKQR